MHDNPERETAEASGAPAADDQVGPPAHQTGGARTLPQTNANGNPRTASDFLRRFIGDPTEMPWVISVHKPRKGSRFETSTFDDAARAADWFNSHNRAGRNIYFNPATMRDRLTNKAVKEDVSHSVWLWADADPEKLHPDAVQKMTKEAIVEHYRVEREKIRAIIEKVEPKPSVVIDSGNGYQTFWKLTEPLKDIEAIEGRNRWCKSLIGSRADPAWSVDHVMRLPGTKNFPNEKKIEAGITWSRMASVVEELTTWAEYDPSVFQYVPPPEKSPDAGGQLANFDFDNLPIVGELQSIPALHADPGLCHLIEHDHNPGMQPAYKSRSEAVLAAVRRMYNAGIEPPTIAAIILDARFAISASVLEKGRSAKEYARKQVEKVLATASNKRVAKQMPAGGIQTYDRQTRDISADGVTALMRRNGTTPSVFMFGNAMARISGGKIEMLDDDKATHELGRAADWFTMAGKDALACPPPRGIVNDIRALRPEDNPLPKLEAISAVPLVRADGSICQDNGYDAASKTYFVGLTDLDLRPVPDQPTADDISTAKQIICEELLGDFRFVSDADKAAAVGCMLTGFARPMISGPTPPFMFEKPKERTGATLLVSVIAYPMLGTFMSGVTWPTKEEDHEKMLLSMLIEGPQFFMYDNIKSIMRSASFCSATTADSFQGRVLGASKMGYPKVRCTWTLTANNPAMDAEVAKRMVRVRIDSKMTNPEERTDFRHPNLKQWAVDNRGYLIWAALTLIRGWKTGGAVKGTATLGMYESWVEVIGGILDHAGIPGLLTNRREFLMRAAPDDDAMKVFVARWWNAYGNSIVKTATLLKLIDDAQVPMGIGGETDRARAQSLGRKLQMAEDSPFQFTTDRAVTLGVTLIKAGKEHNTGAWRLQVTEPEEFEADPAGNDPGKVRFDDAAY